MGESTQTEELYPDLIIYGGTILTMDTRNTRVDSLAIRAGRIIATGSSKSVLRQQGPRTRTLDLEGKTAVPGFIETHSHPITFGLSLSAAVDVATPPNRSITDICQGVDRAVRSAAPGDWIRGYKYDDSLLLENRHPDRHDLDEVSKSNPVYLRHISGHFCVLNSAALGSLGFDKATPDPEGGHIARYANGEPTGLMIETAAFQVVEKMPQFSRSEIVEALSRAGSAYSECGITTVHDTAMGRIGGGVGEMQAYIDAKRLGKLDTRFQLYLVNETFDEVPQRGTSEPELILADDSDISIGVAGVKLWADGSIQGLTAGLQSSYACKEDSTGELLCDQMTLNNRVSELHTAGWQVAIHGNGDAAIDSILEAYEQLETDRSIADRRHRIEHCQMAHQNQLQRIIDGGILPTFFIKHIYYWGDRHRDRFIGIERASKLNPLRSAAELGIPFALHSDTPVTPPSPIEGIATAVNRLTSRGDILGKDERVNVESALRGYTSDAAGFAFEEKDKGTLEVGKLADIAILDRDPTRVHTADIYDIQNMMTIINGVMVWERPSD